MKLSKSFHNQFTQMIKNMGIQSVYGPMFYQAKYGLRFEMGVGCVWQNKSAELCKGKMQSPALNFCA